MSLIPFLKEEEPKLNTVQVEVSRERISVRAVAGFNIAQAAERSFPHITLNDSLLESLQSEKVAQPVEQQPTYQEVSPPAPVAPEVTEQQYAPETLEAARARVAHSFNRLQSVPQPASETQSVAPVVSITTAPSYVPTSTKPSAEVPAADSGLDLATIRAQIEAA